MSNPDVDLVVSYYEARNRRDDDHYDVTHAPDVTFTAVGGVEGQGIDLVKAFDAVWVDACSDFHIEGVFHVGDGGRVVCHNIALGTHDGTLVLPDGTEVAPTGATIGGPYFAAFEVRDGKIVSEQIYFDRMMVAEQVGLVPAPVAAAH